MAPWASIRISTSCTSELELGRIYSVCVWGHRMCDYLGSCESSSRESSRAPRVEFFILVRCVVMSMGRARA